MNRPPKVTRQGGGDRLMGVSNSHTAKRQQPAEAPLLFTVPQTAHLLHLSESKI
jgi:hypothetical protein